MHLIIYVRFYYENKCSKINCFISAKIFNLSIELTGVFKCYLNPGGSYSKSSPLTPSKTIFIPSLSPFSKPFPTIFTKTTTTFPSYTHENHFQLYQEHHFTTFTPILTKSTIKIIIKPFLKSSL